MTKKANRYAVWCLLACSCAGRLVGETADPGASVVDASPAPGAGVVDASPAPGVSVIDASRLAEDSMLTIEAPAPIADAVGEQLDAATPDGSDAAPIVVRDFPTFWSDLLVAYAARLLECHGDPSGSSTWAVGEYGREYEKWTREIAAQRVRFDALGAAACLQTLRGSCRDLTAAPGLTNLPAALGESNFLCPGVFDGLVEAGHFCGSFGECKDPAFECVSGDGACKAACQARVPIGSPCFTVDERPCVQGANCPNSRCVALPGLGQGCGVNKPCAPGLWCATAPGDSSTVCRHTAQGNPCEMSQDCPRELRCVGVVHDNSGQVTSPGRCQPGFPAGTACSEPVPCADGLVCRPLDLSSKRSVCGNESEFCNSLYCAHGTTCVYWPLACVPSLPHNAPCSGALENACAPEEFCSRVGDGSSGLMTCQGNERRLGDACEPATACEAGTFCPEGDTATCTKYRLPGESCVGDGDCGPYDSACTNGRCVPCK